MIQDQNLNQILKKMWTLDHKITVGETLTSDEENFFKGNLKTIKKYYFDNSKYWQDKDYPRNK